MPLQLLPMEEADIDALLEINYQAFQEEFDKMLFPNGYGEKERQADRGHMLEAMTKESDKVRFMKVIDTDLPADDPLRQSVGGAIWYLHTKERTVKELDEDCEAFINKPLAPGANVDLFHHFRTDSTKGRREKLGTRPHILLQSLATLPKHHRRGVGGMHLKWGSQLAEKLGLPMYLEASPKGRPLYERNGFEKFRDLAFDAREWGLDSALPHVCMYRPAPTPALSTNGATQFAEGIEEKAAVGVPV